MTFSQQNQRLGSCSVATGLLTTPKAPTNNFSDIYAPWLCTSLYDSWSDDTVLPLINLHLASYPTAETGGYTPLQLKYGTEDARYFELPDHFNLEPGVLASRLVKQLDNNLQLVRKLSLELQTKIAPERAASNQNISTYELVISSCSTLAKNQVTIWTPDSAHLGSVHTKSYLFTNFGYLSN